ncbi:MAG: zinc ribbon domain-containing protein [Acidobacteriota bacterium]
MFCPKCSSEIVEGQKFCKMCGTNMQLVTDAINRSDDTLSQFGIDVEALKRNATEFVKNMKVGLAAKGDWKRKEYAERRLERQRKRERERHLPKPKDWLPYSWQHNLKHGLISLFTGAGLGFLLYYLGRVMINEGTIQDIESAAGHHIRGLETLASLIWLIALVPVLKGLAQIIYAAFFGESLAKLAERFLPPPQVEPERTTSGFANLEEPMPSVTENTTQFFEETSAQPRRETQ